MKRDPETEEQLSDRLAKEAQARSDDIATNDQAIDDMIKRSIKFHGP